MSALYNLAKEFLSQKNIAVAGVKRQKDDAANVIFKKLKETGYNVFPVNPNTDKFQNETCYPNLKSIPAKLDGVVIVTKPSNTEKLTDECIEIGVPRVWMHCTFGYKGRHSKISSISENAVEKCKQNNVQVIPGGCPMMFCDPVDFPHKCIRGIVNMIGGFKF